MGLGLKNFSLIRDVKLMGPALLRHSVCGPVAESSREQWPYPSKAVFAHTDMWKVRGPRAHRYALEKPGKLHIHACLFKERRHPGKGYRLFVGPSFT